MRKIESENDDIFESFVAFVPQFYHFYGTKATFLDVIYTVYYSLT
ncbi:hypothetical protein [Streptococcus agalactiae]|nr:hypothetical protein [Streptococcus agalactiae]